MEMESCNMFIISCKILVYIKWFEFYKKVFVIFGIKFIEFF